MSDAIWTPLAEAELEDIVYYIAVEDGRPRTAEQVAHEIRDRAEAIANTSPIWQKHADLPSGWFFALYKRWVIAFQEHPSGIEVLRVMDGGTRLHSTVRTNWVMRWSDSPTPTPFAGICQLVLVA